MQVGAYDRRTDGVAAAGIARHGANLAGETHRSGLVSMLRSSLNGWLDMIAPSPWSAHVGLSAVGTHTGWVDHSALNIQLAPRRASKRPSARAPLYTAAERQRRDATPWTMVQGVLAPIQFLAFAVSLALIFRYMLTGQGYGAATASILIKTFLLYAIMITGSIWEKVVFGKWLFAKAFFWEDVFSMLVLGLQTAYLVSLLLGIGTASQQMLIAVAAYAAYAVNASQFLLKLRAARLEGASPHPLGAVA